VEVTTSDEQQLRHCPHPAEHAKKPRGGAHAVHFVVRQQVTVKLFEGLKGRAVPSGGICKILTSSPFKGMNE